MRSDRMELLVQLLLKEENRKILEEAAGLLVSDVGARIFDALHACRMIPSWSLPYDPVASLMTACAMTLEDVVNLEGQIPERSREVIISRLRTALDRCGL